MSFQLGKLDGLSGRVLGALGGASLGQGDGLIFLAPLTTGLGVTASGSGTPTFTRATTAYVEDFEGLLKPVLSGEARFKGARKVYNQFTFSQDFSNAAWGTSGTTKVGAAPVSAPNGSVAYEIAFAAANVNAVLTQGPTGYVGTTGTVWVPSFYLRAASGTTTIRLEIQDQGGALLGTTTLNLTSTFQRFSISMTGVNASGISSVRVRNNAAGDSANIYIAQAQLENVTGQSNQNPSEYVSVGVLSAPYHGANVDGVKYFDTENGNTVTANVVTEAAGAAIAAATLDGILLEGASTNVLLQSQTLGTTWTISNAADMNAVAADAYVAPDGTTTMDKLQPKATTAVHSLDQAFTFTAAVYTTAASLRYVPATPQRWVALVMNDGTTTWAASFDLLNGVAGAVSNATSTIEATNDANVWRVTVTKSAAAAAAAGTVKISLNATDTATLESAARAGTETLGAWGAQLEAGAFASTYIPTTTIAVARNASVDQYVSAGNVQAAAGSVYVEFTPQHAPSGTIFLWGTYVDASNYTALLHDATNLIMRKRIAAVNYDATIANAFVSGTTYKCAGSWGGAGVNVYLSGTKGTGNADTTAAQIGTNMQWGADGNGAGQPFAAEKGGKIYNRALSDARLQAMTT